MMETVATKHKPVKHNRNKAKPKAKPSTASASSTSKSATAETNGSKDKHHTLDSKERQPTDQPPTTKANGLHQPVKHNDQAAKLVNPNDKHHPVKTKGTQLAVHPHRDVKAKEKADDPQPTPAQSSSNPKNKAKKAPRSIKAESQNVHFKLVMQAAKTVVEIMKEHDLPCAVFGSLAGKLYGSSRCPKDVDIIICQPNTPDTVAEIPPNVDGSDSNAPSTTPESLPPSKKGPLTAPEIKELILKKNSRNFYLKMPRDPTAEFRILWYRESYMGPECKVDILVPGIMHLPLITPQQTRWIDGIPLVPFSLLLLHKLQGWDDHRKAEEGYKQKKQQQDAGDVRKLMGLKREMGELKKEKPWSDTSLFSLEFQELTKERVRDYCLEFPDRADGWKFLGFDVPPVVVKDKEAKAKDTEEPEDGDEDGDEDEVNADAKD